MWPSANKVSQAWRHSRQALLLRNCAVLLRCQAGVVRPPTRNYHLQHVAGWWSVCSTLIHSKSSPLPPSQIEARPLIIIIPGQSAQPKAFCASAAASQHQRPSNWNFATAERASSLSTLPEWLTGVVRWPRLQVGLICQRRVGERRDSCT